jgi:hypothetical protein
VAARARAVAGALCNGACTLCGLHMLLLLLLLLPLCSHSQLKQRPAP